LFPARTASSGFEGMLTCFVGGVGDHLQRLAVEALEGTLSDSRQRFLGAKPVKLERVTIQGAVGVLALSSRTWISYNHQVR
jgi:splicing factor 3B subunit 3